mgnify:CR=1 FL=1
MKSSGVSAVSVVGDAVVIPMDVDVTKEGGDATRKGEPADSIGFDGPSTLGQPATAKTEVVDVDIVEVDKPVGRPAVKKIPEPEKEKAPETKARYGRKPRA